jgi:hypothetical protein
MPHRTPALLIAPVGPNAHDGEGGPSSLFVVPPVTSRAIGHLRYGYFIRFLSKRLLWSQPNPKRLSSSSYYVASSYERGRIRSQCI